MDELKSQAELMAEDAAKPKELSHSEYKAAMRAYFTRRNPTVQACGHKFKGEPKNNCTECWYAFFQNYGELTKTADEVFQNEGRQALEALKGKKFVKYFIGFMAAVANFVKEMQPVEEGNGNKETPEQ